LYELAQVLQTEVHSASSASAADERLAQHEGARQLQCTGFTWQAAPARKSNAEPVQFPAVMAATPGSSFNARPAPPCGTPSRDAVGCPVTLNLGRCKRPAWPASTWVDGSKRTARRNQRSCGTPCMSSTRHGGFSGLLESG